MNAIEFLKFITNHPLNTHRKMAAISEYLKWQVGSRLVPGQVVYEWINGSKFLVRTGETGLTGNIYTGLHEFPEMGFLLHVIRDQDLFVDVGANVGSYSILACAAGGARGVAFEPAPATYKRLLENIRINHLENRVLCFNQAVGREKSVIQFTTDMDTVNHALAAGEKHTNVMDVDVVTLDAILMNETPAFIKIDVEGFETPVLEGASDTLIKPSLLAVIMELNGSGNRYGFDESKILRKMLDAGFKTYTYNPYKREVLNLNGKNLDSGNTIFIRDEIAVQERIHSAPKLNVHGKQL
jgi:FkbM family methyltransferase